MVCLHRVSPHTILTYCTNSILLRTLLCGDSLLATVTHVVIDEVQVRDRLSDFMLIVLRDALAKYRGLKLVLMSASLDTTMFSKYFTSCPIIAGNICPVITGELAIGLRLWQSCVIFQPSVNKIN